MFLIYVVIINFTVRLYIVLGIDLMLLSFSIKIFFVQCIDVNVLSGAATATVDDVVFLMLSFKFYIKS